MTDADFEVLREYYENWKARRRQGTQVTEDETLRWAYETSQDDAVEQVIKRLFD